MAYQGDVPDVCNWVRVANSPIGRSLGGRKGGGGRRMRKRNEKRGEGGEERGERGELKPWIKGQQRLGRADI